MEESVDVAENKLDNEEYKITQLQKQLSAQASLLLSPPSNSDISSLSSRDSDSATHSLEIPHNPLHNKYLSRLGDVDLLRKAYSELVFEHNRLQELQERNQKFGLESLKQQHGNRCRPPVVDSQACRG
jgi:hypothetical protein